MISKIVGEAFILFSLLHLVPAAFSIFIKEYIFAIAFSVFSLLILTIGYKLSKRNVEENITSKKPYLIVLSVVIVWLILPLIDSVFYFLYDKNIFNSIFHSFSAWTTTGFLLYDSLNSLPLIIKFWMAYQEWMGGLGIVTFLVLLLTQNDLVYKLIKIEGREEFIGYTIRSSAIKVTKVYILLTFIFLAFLSFTGLDFYNSLLLSFTSISTGGMADVSILNFEQKFLVSIFIILSAIPFSFYINIQRVDRIKAVLRIYESIFWFISFILFFIGILFFTNLFDFDNFFHLISAVTTTGFQYYDLKNSNFYGFLLTICIFIGGCIGSTAGGLRIDRFAILLKGVFLKIKKMINPKETIVVEKFSNQIINEEILGFVAIFTFIYVLFFVIGSLIFYYETNNLEASIFLAASSIGNNGLEMGILKDLSIYSKIFVIFLMFIGRLEILVVLAFIPSIVKFFKEK